MRHFKNSLILLVVLIAAAVPLAAQQGGARPAGGFDPRDLNGVWNAEGSNDVTDHLLPGEVISFTSNGAERYRNVDISDAPSNRCLPYGVQRSMLSALAPYQFVQTPTVMVVAFENQGNYRLIYTDGRKHPEDIYDYPNWFGHSIGWWEGNTFVVETVGFNGKTHMDIGGLEHGTKLKLTERFTKTDANTIRWTTTVEDPEFFTKPWTYGTNLQREDTNVMPAFCAENERDAAHMMPTIGGRHRNKDKLVFPNNR